MINITGNQPVYHLDLLLFNIDWSCLMPAESWPNASAIGLNLYNTMY